MNKNKLRHKCEIICVEFTVNVLCIVVKLSGDTHVIFHNKSSCALKKLQVSIQNENHTSIKYFILFYSIYSNIRSDKNTEHKFCILSIR